MVRHRCGRHPSREEHHRAAVAQGCRQRAGELLEDPLHVGSRLEQLASERVDRRKPHSLAAGCVGELLLPQDRVDARAQLLGRKRTGDVVVGAEREAADDIVGLDARCGDEDDGKIERPVLRAQESANLVTRHPGHLPVEQHQIRKGSSRLQHFHHLRAVAELDELEARPERAHRDLALGRTVIDNPHDGGLARRRRPLTHGR